jgi:hypothetical protein
MTVAESVRGDDRPRLIVVAPPRPRRRVGPALWAFVATVPLSLLVTLGAGVELVPDVGLYISGVGLYPSPLGTGLGEVGGRGLLAAVHALAVAGVVSGLVRRRVPPRGVLAALPVLLWLVPLGVDAPAAALLALAAGRPGARGWAWVAATVHLAALAPAVGLYLSDGGRRARAGTGALLVGLLALALTPYGGALVELDFRAVLFAVPAMVCVCLVGLAPVAVLGFPGRKGSELAGVGLGVAAVVAYASIAHRISDADVGTGLFASTRYLLPFTVAFLIAAQVSDGRTERPTTAPTGGMET